MKIAIVGTGNIGAAYARALTQARQDVVIGDRAPAKAAALAHELGGHAEGGGIAAAISIADIVILALPYPATVQALNGIGDVAGKILVDVSNPVSADFRDLVVGLTTSAAEELQAAAPSARVVKAFNTIFAQLVPAEARKKASLQVFVAGDDAAAKNTVRQLAMTLGFTPVGAGPLRNSRFLEPLGMMNIQFGYSLGVGPATAPAWVEV